MRRLALGGLVCVAVYGSTAWAWAGECLTFDPGKPIDRMALTGEAKVLVPKLEGMPGGTDGVVFCPLPGQSFTTAEIALLEQASRDHDHETFAKHQAQMETDLASAETKLEAGEPLTKAEIAAWRAAR